METFLRQIFLWAFLGLLSWQALAQPSYQAFRKEYEPHEQRPGMSEPAAVMMNALEPETIGRFLIKYWQEDNKDLVFALLVSIEREKACMALETIERNLAVSMLNYMSSYWSVELAWHFSPTFYQEVAPLMPDLVAYGGASGALAAESPTSIRSINVPLFYEEHFSDNKRLWDLGTELGVLRKVAGGNLHIAYEHVEGGNFFDKGIYIDPDDDFYIETSVKCAANDYNATFALTWGRSDTKNFFAFSIQPAQKRFQVYAMKAGLVRSIIPWTDASDILQSDGYQTIGVHRDEGELVFTINGQEVGVVPYEATYGQYTGFLLLGKMYLLVDYLQLYAPEPIIHIVENASHFAKENLGNNINSKDLEHTAVVSADEKTLYFSRKSDSHWESDIWVSRRDASGAWGMAKRLDAPINNAASNSVVSMSTDGQTLILNNRYAPDGAPNGKGLSIAKCEGTNWGVPADVVIEDYYNDQEFVSNAISPDEQVMVMAVERSDSHGNLDLYVSFKMPNGHWSKPKNMGLGINSKGQEAAPFIASDNRTLYFSTDGRAGYGSADIFVTRRLDDTWTKWSTPKNLGPQVNSEQWDGYYSVPANGEYAYFCSYQGGMGQSDIFRIKLVPDAKPAPVMLVYGAIRDSVSGEPVHGHIAYSDASSGLLLGTLESQTFSGLYKIAMPSNGTPIAIKVSAKGYLPYYEALATENGYAEVKKDIVLQPLAIGSHIKTGNVFFKRGRDEILAQSFAELDKVAALMQDNPSMRIRVEGHTDGLGDHHKLMRLSEARAHSVKQYLVRKGIDSGRIEEKGFGKTQPIAPNDTEENLQRNRRVEFVVITL